MTADENTISVRVRNLSGAAWNESWTMDKLVYFILMCDVGKPKFRISAQLEWVPYAQNEYSWDKSILSERHFQEIASKFPQCTARPFVEADCDNIALSYVDAQHVGAVGLDRKGKGAATKAIIAVCGVDATYVEFDYARGRHIFCSVLDGGKVAQLRSQAAVRKDLKRVHPRLVRELDTGAMVGRPVVLFCRDDDFEPPITLWFEP